MSWLRVGDTAANDPRTLHPLNDDNADERTVDEVFGFSIRLAAEAGSKETDRKVTLAMTRALAGTPARAARLMEALEAAGVWKPCEDGWELVNDANYIHLLSQDVVDNQRIRGRDSRNDALTVKARLRDGDNCRYCGDPVNWRDRKSLMGATWEHVNIANQPTQLDEFVVCCFECNREPSSRGPLLPPPAKPVYGDDTKRFVKERIGKWPTRAEIAQRLNLRTQAGDATGKQRTDEEHAPNGQRTSSESATSGPRPARENAAQKPAQDARQRPENASENAHGSPGQKSTNRSSTRRKPPPGPDLTQGGLTDLDLPGRDGTGSSGSGSAPPGRAEPGRKPPSPDQAKPKRSRRSKSKPAQEEQ